MVHDLIESRAWAHLTGLLQRKQMIVRGKAVLPVFGTLPCRSLVPSTSVILRRGVEIDITLVSLPVLYTIWVCYQ